MKLCRVDQFIRSLMFVGTLVATMTANANTIRCALYGNDGPSIGSALVEVKEIKEDGADIPRSRKGFLASAEIVLRPERQQERRMEVRISGGEFWKNSYVHGLNDESLSGLISPGIVIEHLTGAFPGSWGIDLSIGNTGERFSVICPTDKN